MIINKKFLFAAKKVSMLPPSRVFLTVVAYALPPFSFEGSFEGVSLKRPVRGAHKRPVRETRIFFPLKENPSREGGSCPPHGFF